MPGKPAKQKQQGSCPGREFVLRGGGVAVDDPPGEELGLDEIPQGQGEGSVGDGAQTIANLTKSSDMVPDRQHRRQRPFSQSNLLHF